MSIPESYVGNVERLMELAKEKGFKCFYCDTETRLVPTEMLRHLLNCNNCYDIGKAEKKLILQLIKAFENLSPSSADDHNYYSWLLEILMEYPVAMPWLVETGVLTPVRGFG